MSGSSYKHGHHSKGILCVHVIFATKYRHKVFEDEKLKDAVKESLQESARNHEIEISDIETDKDHVHMLIHYRPKECVADIAHYLKQESTWRLWAEHSKKLKKFYWDKKKRLWSGGYFYCSIGEASKDTIERYIQNQG